MTELKFPLMKNNILRDDLDELIKHLKKEDPKLTHGPMIRQFEESWAKWVGTKYSVCVNSGSSANDLTMLAVKHFKGDGEVLVPPLTWVSDIASIIHAGLTPKFVDISLETLAMNEDLILEAINEKTRAVFLTHVLGLNGLTRRLIENLRERDILLIEDVCESHGAKYESQKLGTFGWASNFSFYYAHHLTTIEGGAVCTDDENLYEFLRSARSHGLLREVLNEETTKSVKDAYPDLNPEFIFQFPAHNMRPTELTGVLGLSQLKRIDENITIRNRNFETFLKNINSNLFFTNFKIEGQSNYALMAILNNPDFQKRDVIERNLTENGIEYRRGLSGGGNQLRQPYLKKYLGQTDISTFPIVEHVHHFSWYLGNYPELSTEGVLEICEVLNNS